MNILVINPNSTAAMNDVIYRAATQAAKRSAGGCEEYTNLSVIGLAKAPALINSELDEITAGFYLLEKIQEIGRSYDGFLVACHSDPAVYALRELTGKPVIGIGYASLYSSLLYEDRISILAISERSVERKQNMLKKYGFENRRFFVLPTGYHEEMCEEEAREALVRAGITARDKYHSKAIVLGCAGMAALAETVEREAKLPVIDGVAAGVHLLEGLIRRGKDFLK